MYLIDKDIKASLESWDIVLSDFDEKRLQPASYDILLGNKFMIVKSNETSIIDPVNKIMPKYEEIILNDWEPFILHPSVSVLWMSYDYFWSKKYLIQLWGKSSLARIWLIVHNTAWLINPGHFLNVTFELCNLNSVPIILRPKMEIAQLTFSVMSGEVTIDYKQKWRYGEGEQNWKSYVHKE